MAISREDISNRRAQIESKAKKEDAKDEHPIDTSVWGEAEHTKHTTAWDAPAAKSWANTEAENNTTMTWEHTEPEAETSVDATMSWGKEDKSANNTTTWEDVDNSANTTTAWDWDETANNTSTWDKTTAESTSKTKGGATPSKMAKEATDASENSDTGGSTRKANENGHNQSFEFDFEDGGSTDSDTFIDPHPEWQLGEETFRRTHEDAADFWGGDELENREVSQ